MDFTAMESVSTTESGQLANFANSDVTLEGILSDLESAPIEESLSKDKLNTNESTNVAVSDSALQIKQDLFVTSHIADLCFKCIFIF